MLNRTVSQQENALEVHLCEPFSKVSRKPLDNETAHFLMQLFFCNDLVIPDEKKPFLVHIIETRLKNWFSFKIKEDRLKLFIASVCENPATTIMYLAYLQYWCKKNNVLELNYEIFCMRIFPYGLPCPDELQELWKSTKVEMDNTDANLVDFHIASTSIQFN